MNSFTLAAHGTVILILLAGLYHSLIQATEVQGKRTPTLVDEIEDFHREYLKVKCHNDLERRLQIRKWIAQTEDPTPEMLHIYEKLMDELKIA